MAGHPANLFDGQQQDIAVTIRADSPDALEVAGLFALAPQPLTRSRPVYRVPAGHRFQQGLAVHPGEHHHASARRLLRDGRDHAVLVPLEGVQPELGRVDVGAHKRTSMPRSRMYSFA